MKIEYSSGAYFLINSAVINPFSQPSFSSSLNTFISFTLSQVASIALISSLNTASLNVLLPYYKTKLKSSLPSAIAFAKE